MEASEIKTAFQLPREQEIEVVGTQYGDCPQNHVKLAVGQKLVLIPEPDNPHDKNAVQVCTWDHKPLGHLPALWAARYSPFLQNQNMNFDVVVTQTDARQYAERPLLAIAITATVRENSGGEEILTQLLNSCMHLHIQCQKEFQVLPTVPEEEFDENRAMICLRKLRIFNQYASQLNVMESALDQSESGIEKQFPSYSAHDVLAQIAETQSMLEREQRALRNQVEDIEDDAEYERQTREIRKEIKAIRAKRDTALTLLELNDKLLALPGAATAVAEELKTAVQNEPAELIVSQQAQSEIPEISETAEETALTNTPQLPIDVFMKSNDLLYAASGRYDGQRLTVMKGSYIRLDTKENLLPETAKMRADSNLVDGFGKLWQDIAFSSPNSAARFICGRAADGYIEWKVSDGRTLREYLGRNLYQSDEEEDVSIQTDYVSDIRTPETSPESSKQKAEEEKTIIAPQESLVHSDGKLSIQINDTKITASSWSEVFAEICEYLIVRFPFTMANAPVMPLTRTNGAKVFLRKGRIIKYHRLSNAIYSCPIDSREELELIIRNMKNYIGEDYEIQFLNDAASSSGDSTDADVGTHSDSASLPKDKGDNTIVE